MRVDKVVDGFTLLVATTKMKFNKKLDVNKILLWKILVWSPLLVAKVDKFIELFISVAVVGVMIVLVPKLFDDGE